MSKETPDTASATPGDLGHWTFLKEIDIPKDATELLVPGEQPMAAYATVRASAIFTDRRLILRDAQGITGKKVEFTSIPWHGVHMWATENPGHLDASSDLKLWIRPGLVTVKLMRGIDVRRLDSLIAARVLA